MAESADSVTVLTGGVVPRDVSNACGVNNTPSDAICDKEILCFIIKFGLRGSYKYISNHKHFLTMIKIVIHDSLYFTQTQMLRPNEGVSILNCPSTRLLDYKHYTQFI